MELSWTHGLLALLLTGAMAAAQVPCGDEVVLHELDAGTTGPVLRTPEGAPVVGGSFALRVEGGPPLETGVIFYSPLGTPVFDPVFGATIYPGLPLFYRLFGTNVFGRSKKLFNAKTIGADLCGIEVFFQAGMVDAGAPGGLAMTNAVRIRIGAVTAPVYEPAAVPTPASFLDVVFADVDGDGLCDRLRASDAGTTWLNLALAGGGFAADTEYTYALPSEFAPLVGDLNGDGEADLTAMSADDGAISVLLLDSALAVTSSASYPSSNLNDGAQADFDLDGDLDTVVSRQGIAFGLFEGAGDGTFLPVFGVLIGVEQEQIEAADMNEDGAPDFVASVTGMGTVVALGKGDLTFAISPATGGAGLLGLTVVDLDDDGHLDVGGFNGPTMRVHLGNGDGTLQAAQDTTSLVDHQDLVFVDLDGDDLLEAVALAKNQPILTAQNERLFVRLGLGAGVFGAAVEYEGMDRQGALAASDVDLDGTVDVHIVSHELVTDSITMLGNGDGTLRAIRVLMETSKRIVAVADLDGNGYDDLLIREPGVEELVVYLTTPSGLTGPTTFSFPVIGPIGLSVADVNGDGLLDVFSADSANPALVALLGDGLGGFSTAVTSPGEELTQNATIADFDGDGVADVAVVATAMIASSFVDLAYVFLGNGDGSFGAPTAPTAIAKLYPNARMASGHLNGDGFADFVVATHNDVGFPTEGLWVLLSNGDGTFSQSLIDLQNAEVKSVRIADVNSDDEQDIVAVTDWPGAVAVWLGHGDGTFQSPINTSVPSFFGLALGDIHLGDFDQNGAVDFLYGVATLYGGNDDGTFTVGSRVHTMGSVFPGDFDGDGICDLVVSDGVRDRIWFVESRVGD